MKYLSVKRIVSSLLVLCLMFAMIPVFAPVEAEAVSGINNLTCSSFISNTWHRTYIDTMMKHYLNSYSKLTTALDNGKNVIFMFEGGSDNYPSNTYEDTAYDTRTQAVCIVVQKNDSGNAEIVFSSENCSSIPDDPDNCTGAAYSGATTILDGIYGVQTTNHTGPYGALNTYASIGYYTPPGNQNGYENGASGINIHTRTSAGSGGGWSLGCQVIGYGNHSGNEFNDFMKAVTGITYNVWVTYKSALYTLSGSNLYKDVGYYVIDRQLGCENASGTNYGSGSLIEMYNSTALTNITEWSRAERAKANFGYLSSCTPYASHCEIEITEETPVNTLPCSLDTDDECTTLETAQAGDVYTAVKMYKNSDGNYWYEVTSKSGKTGYIYAGSTSYIRQITSDIVLSGATFPNGHGSGVTFVVNGTIKATGNEITKASVYIYNGFGTSGTAITGYTDTVNSDSYVLAGSTIDNNTLFNLVTTGKHTYLVTCEYINYYAEGATTLKSNTGKVTLAEEYFVSVDTVTNQSSCSHNNSTTVIKAATCTESGVSVVSCSICGLVKKNTVAAKGHSYGNWVVVNPTCTVEGSRTRTCANCGNVEKQSIAASHQYNLTKHPATCKDYQIYEYTCGVCGDNYKRNFGDMTTQWLEAVPDGMDAGLFKTKTQYRYADCTSTSWVKSGSGTVRYVDSWASGFNTAHSDYAKYNKKGDRVTAGETATTKTVVNYDKKVGYLWYHWCDTSVTSSWAYQTGVYNTFHTYYDTVDPSNYPCDTSDMSYGTDHSSCSNAAYWFPMDVYEQSYTTYTSQPDGKQWGQWSDWSDTVYTAVENSRKVETRTVYQLKSAALGDHSWKEGVCTVCGLECEHVCEDNICTICGMEVLSQTYYLFGYINGKDYACESDYANLGEYLFVDGKVTATFRDDSYVGVKTADNLTWYMTNGYLGNNVTAATLYSTSTPNMTFDKLFVPGGHNVTFTLVINDDGTVNLSYKAVACPHSTHTVDGACTNCGVTVEHTYVNGFCVCGMEEPKIDEYYLFGFINGKDYACEADYANIGIYHFVDGSLTVTFTSDSYVGVKTGDNNRWYMTEGWLGYDTTSAELAETAKLTSPDKLYVPGGVEVIFTLIPHEDDTLTLSYELGQPAVTPPTITLKYPTLSFEDEILMNVYYAASNLDNVVEMGLITYSSKVSSYNVTNAEAVVPGYTFSSGDGLYYSTTEGIAAKCLGDTIYFAVYSKLSDGSYTYSPLAGYSPKTYAYNQLKTGNVEQRPLVVAMLNYGAAAQTYFGYKTNALVNADLTAAQKALVKSYSADMMNAVVGVSSNKIGIFANTGSFSRRYPTISFEGAFCINYYFLPSETPTNTPSMYYWTQEAYNNAATLTPGNASGRIRMTQNASGEYQAVVEGIAAKDLDGTIYVSAGFTGSNGTCCSGVLAYSIGSYCVSQAAKTGTLQPFAAATAVYGYYAKQLFYEAA